MKHGQAIQSDGKWFAVIENRETGETYRIQCADQAQAEIAVLREVFRA
ncbi:hypothetical protein LMG18090_04730 [Ralstonia mannitolilytica]|nr:hypothetical protein LMG18090_04730 [Ralstonia mannitolilytica]